MYLGFKLLCLVYVVITLNNNQAFFKFFTLSKMIASKNQTMALNRKAVTFKVSWRVFVSKSRGTMAVEWYQSIQCTACY